MMKFAVLRKIVVLVAVSLVASSAVGAERMVINEHFTSTG